MSGAMRAFHAACIAMIAATLMAGLASGMALAQNRLPSFVDERRLPLGGTDAGGEDDAQRKAAEEAAARERAEEEERARQAAEAQRKAAEEAAARKRAEEEERARQAAEAQRKAAEEAAARKRAEEEERARQAAEAQRKAAEEAAARKRAEEEERARQAAEAQRKAAEEAAARKRAEEEERARQAAEAQRKAAEAQRKAAEEAAARKRAAEQERARQAAETDRNPAADDLARRMSSPGRCENVQLATKPQPAGRIEVNVQAPCLAGRNVTFTYAGHEFIRSAGADGILAFTLDLFEGAQPFSLRLDDGTTSNIDLSAVDLTGISKVAVLWSVPVNLDLHALEYLAPRGGEGHVWAKAPSSLEAAMKASREGSRGRGFISMDDTGAGDGVHAEVYTFLHNKSQRHGAITLLIDYETRGDVPGGEHCGDGKLAQVEALVVRLRPGGRVERETVRLRSAPCGQKLPEAKRFNSDTLSDLVAKG